MLLKCKTYLKLPDSSFWMAGDAYPLTVQDVRKAIKENPDVDFLAHFEPIDAEGQAFYDAAGLIAGEAAMEEKSK